MTSGIIKRCLEEAENSTYRFKIGAVVFKGSRILSSGHNGIRSSSGICNKYKNYENALHAEQAALIDLNWKKLKGASILVIKISKTEKRLSMSKPCLMCQKLLSYIGIKNIYYSNEQGEIVKL